ncbi:putative lipase domain protein [Leishmania major strain Friedlin]|uniref:Putative lipase domain protein n=1 Tax=Leishmania major TaxID=5664 RepID=E9ADY6_LEIMA|nr:putative lipase domain protein [Leishmania major strain Friedlin]CAG9577865.1 lipase_domain_protein_-_putative [Leishmania major strain Friedlin]CBZ12465.1 putative lipase domain protein [Leishmania major strain Friedlin]|eukprot:XP_003722207.1 putative lipase domain protein [Leishmania major strain Friedlin]
MPSVSLRSGDAAANLASTQSPFAGRPNAFFSSHGSAEGSGDGRRLARESAPPPPQQQQQQRAPKPSAPISKGEFVQKARERADASAKARGSRPSRRECQPEEKSCKRRKQQSDKEHRQEVALRQSSAHRRRVIPTAPHRQIFLVGDYYCGAGVLGAQEHESFHAAYSSGGGGGFGNARGVDGGMTYAGASTTVLSNRAATGMSAPKGMSLHASPPVPSGVQPFSNSLGIRNMQTDSPSHSPMAQSSTNTAAFANSHCSHRKRRGPKKLRVMQRFYEPVELQVESISAFAMRLTLVLWHACLIAALVVEVIPKVQWSMVNICGPAYGVDLRRMDKWTSPCVTSPPTVAANGTLTTPAPVSLRWGGLNLTHQHSSMVRYRRVAFSLPPPTDQASIVQVYNVVAESRISGNGVERVSKYPLSIRCDRTKTRCDVARVPELLLGNTPTFAGEFSFTLTLVPESLAAGAAGGSVGIAYQRSAYTVATILWRYTLMVFSLIHTLRFVAYCKYTSTLYEQSWTLVLQVALLWYMNPLFALNIASWPLSSMLAFMEYRIPTYFMAVSIAYMLSVMTASMMWARPLEAKLNDGAFAKLKAFLARSRNVCDPPMWTKILIFVYMLSICVLDIVDAGVNKYMWQLTSNSEVRFKRLYWFVIILQIAGGLVCLLLLFYLRSYLGKKPYLESRPQQLACRVFLMVFLSAIAYCVIHCLVFFLLYNRGYPALASQQPLLQLPMLMVASFFVNIMTLVYTSQSRDENVPVNPRDPRWKHMVWPDTWYRWLARHGGSQYIFATEQEETRFYRLQFQFRRRQYMAKQKRLQSSGGAVARFVPTLAGSTATATLWERAQNAMPSDLFSSMRELQGDGCRATSSLQRDGSALMSWRTDVCASPQPSRLVSTTDTDDDADDGDSQRDEEPPIVRDNGRGAISPVRCDDPSGAPEARRASHPAIKSSPSRRFDGDSGAGAATTTLDMQSSGLWRSHSHVDSNGLMPVSVAARYIINMDRFSTYFLADGDGAAGGDGGVAESYAGVRRDRSLAGDAYAIEGPARWRSRMRQNASAARGLDGRDGSAACCRLSQRQAALSENALAHTYTGFDHHRGRALSLAPLKLAGWCQHHARSRSDGNALTSSWGDADAESARRSCKTASRHGTPPLAPQSRYRDPSAGADVPGDTEIPIAAFARALQAAAATSAEASISVMPHTKVDEEWHKDDKRRLGESEVASSTNKDTFVRQRDPLPCATLPMQAPTADASDANDGGNLKGMPLVRKDDPPTAACISPLLTTDVSCVAPASDGVNADAQQVSVRDGTGSHLRISRSRDGDALSDLSLRTSGDSDDVSSSDRARGRTRSLMRTLVLARERLGALIGTAERNLLERPVRGLERLETHIFDAAYRPFQAMQYLPFFNLETSIDCFNISWEAYGVEESTGGQAIETSIQMTPQSGPRAVANAIKNRLCGCCPAEEDTGGDDAEDDSESEAEQTVAAAREVAGPIVGATDGTAAVPSAIGDARTGQEMHLSTTPSTRNSDTVIVYIRSDDASGGAAALLPASTPALAGKRPPSRSALSPTETESGVPAPTAAATAVPDSAVLPINVEKYGFVRLLVAEAREVQMLMVKMDTSAREHKGKAPRVIIGFRGTANMSNAKYDMNIHRVVWREMEKTADREAANAAGEEMSELASTFDDGSTTAAQHLGCASCIHSCMRKTSWRPTCHAGFLTIWKTLKPTVLSRLRDVLWGDRGTVYRIFTTGHSLGGALASLCAYSITYMLRRMDYPIADVTVYTYGQPRMGNRAFQRIYNKAVPRTFRVVNESDVVVNMFIFGGYHVGIEVDVDRNGNFIVKPTAIEKLFPPTKGRGLMVVNHLMTSYGISLNAIASRTLCPARGLDFYLTADPEKVEAKTVKMEAIHAAPSSSRESRRQDVCREREREARTGDSKGGSAAR